jgi:prophage regulatory protein
MEPIQKQEAQLETPLLTIADVCRITTISEASIYRLGKKGQFPKPVVLGHRTKRWKLSDIQLWIDEL